MAVTWDGTLNTEWGKLTPEQWAARLVDECDKETVRAMAYLGEQCVKETRDRPQSASWIDHTGNLRSSVGYILARGTEILKYSDFRPIKPTATEGPADGKAYAERLAAEASQGYNLIVVAGMPYASNVEAIQGKDVLASTEIFAQNKAPEVMQKLKERLEKKLL